MSNHQDEEVTTSFIQQPNNRQPVSKKKKKRKPKKTRSHQDETKSGLWGLFRYAGHTELALSVTGLFFSVLHGASFPILALVFGQMTNTFMRQATFGFKLPANISVINEDIENNTNTFPDPQVFSTVTNPNISNDPVTSASDGAMTPDEFTYFMGTFSLYYLYIGFGVLTASFIQTYCWELACERQIYRLRQIFFAQILRQDVTWYDSNKHGDLNTKLSDDLERIREGMGSKFSMVTQYLATFISGISVGMYANWRLTSVILAAGPLLVGTSAFMARASATSSAREQLKYSIAGGVAEEVLTCIRTVAAFGGEIKETKRYGAALDEGRILAMKKYYVMSLGLFFVFFVMYASYGLAFWYGSELIASGLSDPGSVFTVFFSVMAGAFSIGNALPYINAVSTAVGAASNIFGIIDRVPDIDPYSDEGIIPDKCLGEIELIDAEFSYPTRPQVPVLGGLNMKISAGQTVAIVGPSGSGKSTIMSLIQRFYDPKKGKVLIDGTDASLLNLKWLRKNIGIVSQEPVLFGVSILENIQYGRDNITFDDIVAAATLANADSFIKELPQGYNTLVGERGAQLSGGQKQRIAIARAVVRDPRILLLDEATSALDAHSESLVQEALDNASRGRTTVIVAHRLSTIRPANTIYAMMDGKVLEFGTHEELMAKEGLYSSLVTAQSLTTEGPDLTPGDGASKNYPYKRGISLTNSTDSGIANVTAKKREEVAEVPVHRLLKLNSPEWVWLTAGLLACSLTGAIMPIFAFFYGQVFSTFTLTGDDLKSAAVFWSCMFVLLGFMSGFSYWCQVVCMATAAEKLVARLRYLAMKNILRQPISWFDEEEFSSGHLITRLARDAPLVKAAAGLRAGQVLTAAVTLVAALTIAFIYGWKLALLLLVAIPFLIFAAYHQTMLLRGTQKRDTDLLNQAGRLSSECVKNIITVQSLGKEELFLKLYTDLLLIPFRENKKHAFVYGIVFAFSQAVIYMMYAGAFRFGAYLIQIGDMVPSEVYRVFFALAFCATSVGQGSAYLQDFTKAKYAAKMIFQLIDKKSEIDPTSASGARPDLRGKVTLKGVELRYPSRPDVAVLRCLDLTIEEGQTVALVGGSGCGKTSVIALLERFYSPTKGCIMIDDIDIRAINLSYLRSQIGLVTQEPVLFDCSIRDNIAYGALALGGNVTDQDIINAARIANIHDFIVSLPQGYETPCGERGTQLSGGQKQRIAIARALIRDPKILLLDEATSALDTENEKIVQEALDKARQGRTSIVIAHRLSTIQNADQIAVIQRGKVVELGTHEELKTKCGIYHELIKRQNL